MGRERKFTEKELYQATKINLLEYDYAGFTFGKLAQRLNVSRATIYKYYENKEELITDYMIDEMNHFLDNLQKINQYNTFESQFDYLLNSIFKDQDIQKLIKIAFHIPLANEKIKQNINRLHQQHQTMYSILQDFIQLGKANRHLKNNLPDQLILGFIFQTIAIPNHTGIPYQEWVDSIKEILRHGLFMK